MERRFPLAGRGAPMSVERVTASVGLMLENRTQESVDAGRRAGEPVFAHLRMPVISLKLVPNPEPLRIERWSANGWRQASAEEAAEHALLTELDLRENVLGMCPAHDADIMFRLECALREGPLVVPDPELDRLFGEAREENDV